MAESISSSSSPDFVWPSNIKKVGVCFGEEVQSILERRHLERYRKPLLALDSQGQKNLKHVVMPSQLELDDIVVLEEWQFHAEVRKRDFCMKTHALLSDRRDRRNVRVKKITNVDHPAYNCDGACGLFGPPGYFCFVAK